MIIFNMVQNFKGEVWKDINGYEGLYQVSNLSRVKSLDRYVKGKKDYKRFRHGEIMRPVKMADGYCKVGLRNGKGQKLFSIHRLVAIAFILNAEKKPFINHKNGVRDDNRIENLEWCTQSENCKHSFEVLGRKPTIVSGDRNYLYGKKGKNHPAFGNKYSVGRIGKLNPNSKPVKCDTLDIVFESANLAAQALGIKGGLVHKVALGNRRHASGLTFRYI